MATFQNTFEPLYDVGVGETFNVGDANNHTFVATVSDKDTSVDFNFQGTLDNENWFDLESTNVQKTANGVFLYKYEGMHCMAVRPKLTAQVGGTKATITVGTVVFTAVGFSPAFENYTVETAVGVAAGSETAVLVENAILITANAASTIGQVQTAIAANPKVAALITGDSLTTFAADTAAALAGSDSVKLDVSYKGGE